MFDKRPTSRVGLAWSASLALHALALALWGLLDPSTLPRPAAAPSGPLVSVRLLPQSVDVPSRPEPTTAPALATPPVPAGPRAALEAPPAERKRSTLPPPVALAASAAASATDTPVTRPERFYRAGELTHLPRLPGEPLIDFADVPRDLDATLSLRLFIDERGRVVAHAVEDADDMPPAISERLRRAFVGYRYVPADIAGTPVRSEVVMRLRVREGQASALGAQ